MNRLKLFLPALLAAAACSGGGGADAPAGAGMLTGVRLSQMTSNTSNWTLNAETARLEESETRIFFERPRLTFFENGKITSELNADTGFLDMDRKDAELRTNVQVVSWIERMTLKTDKVLYSSAKNRIWSDDEVIVLRGRNVLRGSGFTANPDLTEIEINRQVTRVNQPSAIQKGGPRRGTEDGK